MPISIYPPIMQSSLPAFLASNLLGYKVNFRLLKITLFDLIGHVQIRIVRQNNNKSIANISLYPDGNIYKPVTAIDRTLDPIYSITVYNSDLGEAWQSGCLYKIQMRFGRNPLWTQTGEKFATWKLKLIEDSEGGAFSEWSTVMVVKAISKPTVYIQNAEAVSSTDIISTERTEPTLTPLFYGVCTIPTISKEAEDKYKFDLYTGIKDRNDGVDLLETSDWRLHNSSISYADQWRALRPLDNAAMYTLFYSIETVNGYQDAAEPYVFMATRTYLSEIKNTWLSVESRDRYCRENGCLRLRLRSDNQLSGTYVITRSDESTNYEVWEDLKYLTFHSKRFDDEIIFTDFTVESGVKYKYAILQENSAGLRTSPLLDDSNSPHYVDFEYSYLYHNDVLLKLMFNLKVNTFKHTVLTSKQDTLGSRYPHLVKNGYAYYAEFPISGLISFQMDDDRTFFTKGTTYQGELIISNDKFDPFMTNQLRQPCQQSPHTTDNTVPLDDGHYIDHNLTDDNIFIERKFREKVEEFLNNFDYKLYKSPTEGNIVVVLLNVTMTPNATLGRMIYEFSATAYEVAAHDIPSLDEVGIIDIGSFEALISKDTTLTFGLISGIYTNEDKPSVDLYDLIKKQEEVSIGGGYSLLLKEIKSIWIERYPTEESTLDVTYGDNGKIVDLQIKIRLALSAELILLEAELANAKNEGVDTAEISTKIAEYKGILDAIADQWASLIIRVLIGSSPIIVAAGKIYGVEYPITNLKLLSSLYPIIVNYICELEQTEDKSSGVIKAMDATRIWGLVSGILTDDISLIRENYNYAVIDNIPPYRVFSGKPGIIYDANGNLIVDRTNFNLYKTTDIYEIIKEETRKQVEHLYEIRGGFTLTASDEWQGKDSRGNVILYNFSGITAFSIEAEAGTPLMIGKSEDGRDAIPVKIGPSGRYSLTPMDNLVRYIKLTRPSFAIINYKSLTSLSRLEVVGEGVVGANVRVLK